MRVLVVGGGGREHALVWKIAQSPLVQRLYAAPGNPGIARHATCVPIAASALDDLVAFARGEGIDLTVVGPEAPLVAGLAGGKGAIVCRTLGEADAAVAECMERRAFGAAGARVVVEEFLTGEEVSFFALANGRDVLPLAAAQDHKTVFDGDRGPNTGGMGAYSPVAAFDAALEEDVLKAIVWPTVTALAQEDAPYHGVLFVGLMLTREGPKVLEFNCRFGDPECQALVVRAPGDLVPLLLAAARGEAWPVTSPWPPQASVCVTLASGGYPDEYATGFPISGIAEAEQDEHVVVFHAGTKVDNGQVVTAGGRVLGVSATGSLLEQALDRAYKAVEKIHFEGMHFRRDIGLKALHAQLPTPNAQLPIH